MARAKKAEVQAEEVLSPEARIAAKVAELRKKLGQDVFVANKNRQAVEVLPTGLLSVDRILGVGGFPRGRIVEVYGPSASGKTTLALHCVAHTQKHFGACGYIDVEHAMDLNYAAAIGVDLDDEKFLFSQPQSGEQAFEVALGLASAGCPLIVIDSVAALTPLKLLEADFGDAPMAQQARLMSQSLPRLLAPLTENKSTVLFINQLRSKVGVIYGSPEVVCGGQALPYYTSVRVDVRKRQPIKVGEDVVGHEVQIRTVKNKCAPPSQDVTLELLYGLGFSVNSDIVQAGLDTEVLTKSGAWVLFGEQKIGQGTQNASAALAGDKELYDQVVAAIRSRF